MGCGSLLFPAKPENDRGKEKTRRDVMDRYYKKRFVPLALPALILFVMVIVIPFIMGVIYSFTAWRGTYFAGGDHFCEADVGFDNMLRHLKPKNSLMRLYIPLR